jgi:hypothetical protein
MVGRRLLFDDDCTHLNWGSELMMIQVRIARKSIDLVLGLLVGRKLGFDCDHMPLNSSVQLVSMHQLNKIELAVL